MRARLVEAFLVGVKDLFHAEPGGVLLDPFQRSDDVGRGDLARAFVAGILDGRQTSENRQGSGALRKRQDLVVLQKDGGFLCRFEGDSDVLFARVQIGGIVFERIFARCDRVQGFENATARAVDHYGFDRSVFNPRHQLGPEVHGFRVLDIEPGCCTVGMVDTHHPVGMDKSGEAPLRAQNIGQQHTVLAAIFAVHLVVGAHDAEAARIQSALEMRQVNLVQGTLVDPHVHLEARVFHGVQREVFDAGDDIVRLDSGCQSRAHFAEEKRVFSIGFLRASPRGVAQQIDADRAREVAAIGAGFLAHDFADPQFEIGIESRTARHRAGKAGRLPPRDPPRPIGEVERRNAQPFDTAAGAIGPRAPFPIILGHRGKEPATRHHRDLFLERRFAQDVPD